MIQNLLKTFTHERVDQFRFNGVSVYSVIVSTRIFSLMVVTSDGPSTWTFTVRPTSIRTIYSTRTLLFTLCRTKFPVKSGTGRVITRTLRTSIQKTTRYSMSRVFPVLFSPSGQLYTLPLNSYPCLVRVSGPCVEKRPVKRT